MYSDYAAVNSSDYNGLSGQGMETPKSWMLSAQYGYKTGAQFFAPTQTNKMVNTSSAPKSYATLSGNAPNNMQKFASANAISKVSFETTSDPDYQSFDTAYVPANHPNYQYYDHSPSANLATVGHEVKKLSMMKSTNNRVVKDIMDGGNSYYEEIPVQCLALSDPAQYDQCIKNDCQAQVVLSCVDRGDCSCTQFDENGNCLATSKPELVQKYTDMCFAEYSTTIQPMSVAKSKLQMKAHAKRANMNKRK